MKAFPQTLQEKLQEEFEYAINNSTAMDYSLKETAIECVNIFNKHNNKLIEILKEIIRQNNNNDYVNLNDAKEAVSNYKV